MPADVLDEVETVLMEKIDFDGSPLLGHLKRRKALTFAQEEIVMVSDWTGPWVGKLVL